MIREVNGQYVATAAEAARALRQVAAGDVALLLILRDGRELFLLVTRAE